MEWLWRAWQGSSQVNAVSLREVPSTPLPPLESNTACIRLLTIDRRTDIDKPVSCTLRAYHRHEAPPYTAISYVWGPPRTPEQRPLEIEINGFSKLVRLNLWAFLEYASISGPLRLWCKESLWIDALCINQDDETEKAHQVSMMGDIYSAAHSVCAWLGAQPNADDWDAWPSWWSWRKGPVYLPSAETSKNNDFWNRMWIVQEMKSARKLAFACGSRLSTAEQFKTTIGKEHGACSWLFDSSLRKHHTLLQDWIMKFHTADCADARDKIFAIQNLVPESQRIEVDYQLTFPEVYLLVLERQFGDLPNRMFDEIKLLHVFLATFVVNLLDVVSMDPGEKYIRMAIDQVCHVEAKVESVITQTYHYNGDKALESTWPNKKPYNYAFSYPYQPISSEPREVAEPPRLQDIPEIKRDSGAKSRKDGERLDDVYMTMGSRGRFGLATPSIRRGDLLCSISGFKRVLAVIRPFVYVPENLAYGELSKDEKRWIKQPLRDGEKLLFIPTVPEGKTDNAKIWLSYQIIGLAIHTNEQQDSDSQPGTSVNGRDRPSNRQALHERLIGMPIHLYLNEERVAALQEFADAYDDPTISITPMDLDLLYRIDDQKEFFIQDPTDPNGRKQMSSKFFEDPKNIVYKMVELAMAEQAKRKRLEEDKNQ